MMKVLPIHSAYYTQRHGGPFDRGHSDFYYGRSFNPHYFIGDTYSTPRIEMEQMTAEEITAYTAGYRYGEELGDRKEW
jgi:hypothetical protein